MGNAPKIRPGPSDSLLAHHQKSSDLDPASFETDPSLPGIAETLAISRQVVSTDLALDLILNEIAEHARIATAASGVAIVLERSDEFVCRATSGNAPGLGIRVSSDGLSALSLRTGSPEHCVDTEIDPRVDAVACSILRVRSILVVPIRRDHEVVGLIEAFSGDAHHFRDHDLETLTSFCRQILNRMQQASEAATLSKLRESAVVAEPHAPDAAVADEAGIQKPVPQTDRWMVVLTIAVIVVALLLGWLWGRADRRRAAARTPGRITRPADATKNSPVQGVAALDANTQNSGKASTASAPSASLRADHANAAAKTTAPESNKSDPNHGAAPVPENGGLVVYQNGKVLFRENGDQPSPLSKTPRRSAASGHTEMLTPQRANEYLSYRVEPQYPDDARQQHLQGTVVLKVLVGKDGGVQQVQLVSGDPKLAGAASAAVIQWKFKPLLRSSQPVEFETQVTVDFKLP